MCCGNYQWPRRRNSSIGCKGSPQEKVLSEARIRGSKHIKYFVLESMFQAKKMQAIKLLPKTLASSPP